MRELKFSPSRALESLLFLANRLDQPTIHEVLKLRYFADKLHLSRYGFIASGDTYSAMQFGPVASNTYNMLKAARGENSRWIHPDFIEAVSGNLVVVEKFVQPLRDADQAAMMRSDVICLEEALRQHGNMGFMERTELSHDAAWKKAWETACNDSINAGEMPILDIAATLPNAEEVISHITA